ncbi:MAG: hypothetical protein GAK38_03650 [Xylophilus sp.]|nr:hypothetical protein [Xylophilus sp.]KAF1044221.1 MAG: hypothetical protein GAK38_03650 [Xylophilus sp.]
MSPDLSAIPSGSSTASPAGQAGRQLSDTLRLPAIASPMLIVSNPDMVIAQCTSGMIGTFPVLNARPQPELSVWLERIETALAQARAEGRPVAPHGVNLVIRAGSDRFADDLAT